MFRQRHGLIELTRNFILTLAILTILASSFCQVRAQAEGESIINVRREIEVGDHGLVKLEDFFTIDNSNEGNSLQQMTFGIPTDFSHFLVYIDGIDENAGKLSIEAANNKTSTIKWFRVMFHEPISPNSVYDFSIRMIFSKMISLESGIFILSYPMHPILPVKAERSNVTIILPEDSEINLPWNSTLSPIEMGGGAGLNEVIAPLEPYTTQVTSFNYSSENQKILECKSMEKRIVFKSNGEILMVDSYAFENLGRAILSFEIDTPDDAEDIMLYDFAGPLWPVKQYGVYSVQVSPRYNRFGSEESFNFRLEYRIDQKNYIKEIAKQLDEFLDYYGGTNFDNPLVENE